jgi:hypothetical protein
MTGGFATLLVGACGKPSLLDEALVPTWDHQRPVWTPVCLLLLLYQREVCVQSLNETPVNGQPQQHSEGCSTQRASAPSRLHHGAAIENQLHPTRYDVSRLVGKVKVSGLPVFAHAELTALCSRYLS